MTSSKTFCALIATADDLLSQQIAKSLDLNDFTVIHAKDGNEAVGMATQCEEIDVMVIDSSLPVMNGYEVVRQVRQSGKTRQAVILLAWFSVQSLSMAYQVGCNELVAKPIDVKELTEVIMKWRKTKEADSGNDKADLPAKPPVEI